MGNNDLLSINPVENYDAPRIPPLDDNGNAEMLKKLPNRWKKKAAVIACAGIMGISALTGCMGHRELDIRFHHGGMSSGPMYVVQLTEQEALGIIRTRLEAAGLNFDVESPGYSVAVGGRIVSLDLFDSKRNVAVAQSGASLTIEQIERDNAADITVGIFRSGTIHKHDIPSRAERTEARENLESKLDEQIQEFVAFLRNEGIL
ncbi:MAG: hypothetical protein FWE04_01370 [Oscillospiraceae bacterium]|nr:hypothetical protein [Oscillospiraceae bacterium]